MDRIRTLAHVSDLHVGHSPARDRATAELCGALLRSGADSVVLTGDVTQRGRRFELEQFRSLWGPLLESGRVAVVPGNHDRLGDDVSFALMGGQRRVQVKSLPGLHVVRVDSTGPHNRSQRASHGVLAACDLEAIDCALAEAPAGALRVLALHHHPLPLPEDSAMERLLGAVGICSSAELAVGADLIRRVIGACDLVLHGHRHRPAVQQLGVFGAPHLGIYNAGSSSELGRVRLFEHRDGLLVREPRWLRVEDVQVARLRPRPRLVPSTGLLRSWGAGTPGSGDLAGA